MDIVLIGMPGSGKTVIGRAVADKLNMPFCDMDEEIGRAEGKTISEIFENEGEEYFRKHETECLEKFIGRGYVISTGGGIVTRDENIKIIRTSGAVVMFIDRPIENIVRDVRTDTRPLLRQGADRIYRLYEDRYDKYTAICNVRVINNGMIDKAVEKIIQEVTRYEDNDN